MEESEDSLNKIIVTGSKKTSLVLFLCYLAMFFELTHALGGFF